MIIRLNLFQADLLLSYGYEEDIKTFTVHVPKRCQCLLMSATSRFVEVINPLVSMHPFS